MNELEKLLKDRLKKELEDVIEYNKLYEIIDHKKHLINHIANDELEHAHKVQCLIDEYGFATEVELQELWKKADECYE